MKTKIYLFIAILCTLFSCAEEGPYRLGKLETSVNLKYATPNEAEIQVTFPKNQENLFIGRSYDAYLVKKRDGDNYNNWREDYVHAYRINSDDNGTSLCRFKELQPDTQYSLILDVKADFNDSNDDEYMYYLTEFSFTTAKEGDYSGIVNVKCEVVDALFEYTKIKIILPEDLFFEGDGYWYDKYYYLEASTSQNMENSIKLPMWKLINLRVILQSLLFLICNPAHII